MTGPKRVAEKQLARSRWNALTRLLRNVPSAARRSRWARRLRRCHQELTRRHGTLLFLRNEPISDGMA